MKFTALFCLLALFLLPGVPASGAVPAGNCGKCHPQNKFPGRNRHQPFARQQCFDCHRSHASRYQGLLLRPADQLCRGCHREFFSRLKKDAFRHRPADRGECGACHDPHAAEFKNLLRKKPGSECYDCHKKDQEKTFKFPHKPFARGECYACHEAHGASNERLLKSESPGICFKCHKPDPALKRAHLGRDLRRVDCLSCHHPHGSDRQELLRSQRHQPFAKGRCGKCHNGSGPARGACLDCHKPVIKTFLAAHNHLGRLEDGRFCLSCHDPHAADQPDLPAGGPGQACKRCHTGKFRQRDKMLYIHPDNRICGNCHQVHGSNRLAMLKDGPDKVCGGCHERHIKFTHPLGDKAPDPRNREPMNCITCHDPCNGTMYEFNLRGDAKRGLCVQCHRAY